MCKRDASIIQRLGANVIRVYNLHADLNHDECVTVFNNAGVYPFPMHRVRPPEANHRAHQGFI